MNKNIEFNTCVDKGIYEFMGFYGKIIKAEYFDVYNQKIEISDVTPNMIVFRQTMNRADKEIYDYCVVTFDMITGNKLEDVVKYIHKVITISCELSLEEIFYDRDRKI